MLTSFYAHVLYSEVDELNVQRSVELQSQQQAVDNLQLGLLACLDAALQVHVVFGRPFVQRFALCYPSVVCLSVLSVCLSVTLLYCSQSVGWIKMKLRTEVGPVSGHIVLDGDPALPPQRGTAPANFGPGSAQVTVC